MKRALFCILALTLLAALPVAAGSLRTVENGIDVWRTPADGTSFVQFDKDPIPKGFFCHKSAAFTGRVALKGRPLATGTPGELGTADTIVQRLDDATFNADGVATTRIQLRALQLESIAPIKTACGDFNVSVSLNGTQPTTTMRIIKETETTGRFVAPIKVQYRVAFTPTAAGASLAQRREIVRSFTLAPAPNATWGAIDRGLSASRQAKLLVDTDNDQIPDTYLPRTSGNFQAGWTPKMERELRLRATQKLRYDYDCSLIVEPDCHPEAAGVHCAMPCGYPIEY